MAQRNAQCGDIHITPEVAFFEEAGYHPIGYDEDGGPLFHTYRGWAAHASDAGYQYVASFATQEEAEAELRLALSDPSRVLTGEFWGERRTYGGVEHCEWDHMDDAERDRACRAGY